MGYLAAALRVVFQQKIFTLWFLYPKGMGLALLLINSKNFGILDPPNTDTAQTSIPIPMPIPASVWYRYRQVFSQITYLVSANTDTDTNTRQKP